MDDYPVEPISIDEIFKQKAVTKYQGKRVTWRCVIAKVQPFNGNWPGLTQPAFPWNSIARASQTVTFTFNDRPSYEKLKSAKGKRATISGIVSGSHERVRRSEGVPSRFSGVTRVIKGESSEPVEVRGAARRPRRFALLANWSAFEFLISLLLLVVVTPFVEDLRLGPLVEAVLLTFVLASAVLAVSDRRVPLLVAMSLALLAVAARWAQHFQPERLPPAIYLSPALALLGFVLVQYFRYILRAPVVTFVVLCAAASTYLMLGLLWAMAYVLVASIDPNAFALSAAPNATNVMTGFNAFYFSFVTLSTVGYGDIVPVSRVARMLAAMEATTGTLYVAMLIARLVSMHASTQPNRK